MNYDNVNTCVAPIPNNDCCVKSTPAEWIVSDHKPAVSYVSNSIWRTYVFDHD